MHEIDKTSSKQFNKLKKKKLQRNTFFKKKLKKLYTERRRKKQVAERNQTEKLEWENRYARVRRFT